MPLERKETLLHDKKLELERLSQYGGGVNAASLPVPYRMTNPKSGLKRPRDQLPEFWDAATTGQKRAIENENAIKRNKLRDEIDRLEADLQNMRAGVALEFYETSNLTGSLAIPSLKGFLGHYAGSGGCKGSGESQLEPGGACEHYDHHDSHKHRATSSVHKLPAWQPSLRAHSDAHKASPRAHSDAHKAFSSREPLKASAALKGFKRPLRGPTGQLKEQQLSTFTGTSSPRVATSRMLAESHISSTNFQSLVAESECASLRALPGRQITGTESPCVVTSNLLNNKNEIHIRNLSSL